jgi:RNA polymerase sigma-70 factor, ECF subfamily
MNFPGAPASSPGARRAEPLARLAYGSLDAQADTDAGTGCSLRRRGSTIPVREPRRSDCAPYVLDPAALPDHMDALYRAAWALCGSRADAEDLVQSTFVQVLKRSRVIRNGNERGYLLRALRNTYATRYRTLARRPATVPLLEEEHYRAAEPAAISSGELMEVIAATPPLYRDAVIAVDILGLSYRESALSLHTGEDTIASRLYRGRQHIARELTARGV